MHKIVFIYSATQTSLLVLFRVLDQYHPSEKVHLLNFEGLLGGGGERC